MSGWEELKIEQWDPQTQKWHPIDVDCDREIHQLREELDELTAATLIVHDRIKRAQRKSYIAVAVTLILAGVLIARMAGWV